jgi:hypothetical protein
MDVGVAIAALRVMTVFVTTMSVTTVDQIAPQLFGVARMLPQSFNEGTACRFLTSIIAKLPAATTASVKILALSLLLPLLYGVVSAYHSVDPFSIFVEDKLVLQVFEDTAALGAAEFGGDARYSEFMVKYFGNDAEFLQVFSPTEFIDEFTNEMWQNDAADLRSLGGYYSEMCRAGVKPVNAAVFSVVRSFVITAPDKANACSIFGDVMAFAASASSKFGKDLLATFSSLAVPGGIFRDASVPPSYQAMDDASLLRALQAAVSRHISVYQSAFVSDGDLTLQDRGCVVPMIPVIGNVSKVAEAERLSLKGVKLQPFAQQQALWVAKSQAAQATAHGGAAAPDPTAFDMFAHTQSRVSEAQGLSLVNKLLVYEPSAFILRDDELGEYEVRLSSS